jgi:Xaa-Pro dipeptidase
MAGTPDPTGRERLAGAQAAMGVEDLDALLLVSSTNLMYLSGYPTVEITLARPFYLLVPRHGPTTLLVHEARAREARTFSWVPDVRTYTRLSRAPIEELADLLTERRLAAGRIGAELGYEQRMGMPFAEFEQLREGLAPAWIVDAADLLWRLRMVKSADEIEAIRRACRITTEAYARTFGAVGAGDSERDVQRRMILEMTRLGGDNPWVAVTSGEGNYDLALGAGSSRRLEPGDVVWMDAGCQVDGYWSDFSRGATVGPASREQTDAQVAIHAITWEAVTMVRPGRPLAEIAAHCRTRIEGLGLPITSDIGGLAGRVGHGIGLDVTEPPHVSGSDPTVLEPGMVISIEPGVATAYGIFHIEENVVCTEDGYEVLSDAPRELATLSAKESFA